MKACVIVHLSDLHIGAIGRGPDPHTRFTATIQAINRLPDRPDAVIISGDLADHGERAEYAVIRDELATLCLPVYAVPGNHDNRAALRASFGLPGDQSAPIDYAAEVGPLRLLMLDSTTPGEVGGDLDCSQLASLEANLAIAPERATVLVMHHPPFRSGIETIDLVGLAEVARLEFARIVEQHPQVCGILSGHLHRPMISRLGGRDVLTAPSTYTQISVDPRSDEMQPCESEPAMFFVHRLLDHQRLSYVQSVVIS